MRPMPFSPALSLVCTLVFAATAAAQAPARVEPARTDARTVTLSLTEYNRLLDLASRPPQGPLVAPVGAVVSSADVRVRVDRDSVRGVFTLAGDVLRAGVNRVNLVSGATLIDGTAAGRPLPLAADGSTHTALLPGPGPFALTLEWGAPLTFGPGRASFVLPVPAAGTAHATLDLPGDQADARISAGLITRRSTSNGRTLVDVTLKPGAATEVWWSMRDSAPTAAARDVRALAEVMTLVTLGDSDVRMASLVDLTVVQGEPRSIEIRLPRDYEITSVSGSTVESREQRESSVVLTLADPAARRHQFLVVLERSHPGGSFTLDTELISLPNVQRERGELAIEGVGTLELAATERSGMHRIDVRELNAALQSLTRSPILSAFRYQRGAGAQIGVAMDVKRFADAAVLAAVAERAVATTLVTSEGRTLTEMSLHVQNRAQPFLKVVLPPGATMVSVEVAGEPAKPVLAPDGTRVPLLRPGFRPTGPYDVSFVYLHAGTPFAKKGERDMTLPRMDLPIQVLEWELFVPDSYAVRAVDGNVIDRSIAGLVSGSEGAATDKPESVTESITVQPYDGRVPPPPVAAPAPQVSQNVINLQKKVSGVLPVRVDVPRAGTSHRFVRPLVIDQETVVSLRYKRR